MRFGGISWAGLFAEDFERLAGFYAEVVGLPVLERQARCVILDAGGGAHFEIWMRGHASGARKTPAQQSLMIGFEVDDLEAAVRELRRLEPDGELGCYLGIRWVHYVDPEGNRFELKDVPGRHHEGPHAP